MRLLDRDNLAFFRERLMDIHSTDQRRWGNLTPVELIRHLRRSVEISLGEGEPVKITSIPLVSPLLGVLLFRVFTSWPRGKIKVPKSMTPDPEGDIIEERLALFETMERFIDTAEEDPRRPAPSPVCGMVTLKYYRRIHGVHLRHHLRQFGVYD